MGMKRPDYIRDVETMDGWQALANAIIEQAAKDYRISRQILEMKPKNIAAQNRMAEVTEFFHSKWCRTLTNVNPEMIFRMLQEEAVR